MDPIPGCTEELAGLIDCTFRRAQAERSGKGLRPFAIAEGSGGTLHYRFSSHGGRHERVLEFARSVMRELPDEVCRYVLAYKGRATDDGADRDAILVEAGERDGGPGFLLAMPYGSTDGVLKSGVLEPEAGRLFLDRVHNHFEP